MYNKRNARRRWGIWYVCPSLPLFRVCALFFPGSSLSVEAPLIGAFSRGHRFGEVSIERGANFFQPNLVRFHLLLWTDRESLHPLKNTNQPVQIPVPQKKFAVVVCFQYSRFLSTDPPVGIQTTLCIEEGGCVLDWLACRRSSSPLSHSRRLAPTATWSEGRPLGQRCDQEEICLVFPCYGGGSATGSGQARAGNMGRVASCAQDRKWITSLAAIVAPHTCDCGKGRVGASNTGASRYVTLFVSCDRLCRGNDPTCIS